MYQSDITLFIQQLYKKNPTLHKEQKEARHLWWDRAPQNPQADQQNMAQKLPAKPYPYYSEPSSKQNKP